MEDTDRPNCHDPRIFGPYLLRSSGSNVAFNSLALAVWIHRTHVSTPASTCDNDFAISAQNTLLKGLAECLSLQIKIFRVKRCRSRDPEIFATKTIHSTIDYPKTTVGLDRSLKFGGKELFASCK